MKKFLLFNIILLITTTMYAQNIDYVDLPAGKTERLEVIYSMIDDIAKCMDDSLCIVSYIDINKEKILYHVIDCIRYDDSELREILEKKQKIFKDENFLYRLYAYYNRLQKTLNK